MRYLILFICLCFAVQTKPVRGQEAKQSDVSLTIYSNNFGVVKESRELTLENKRSPIYLSSVAALLDPGSVYASFNGKIIEQNFRYDLATKAKILEHYINQPITLVDENQNRLHGTLLSHIGRQLILETDTGGLKIVPNSEDYILELSALPEGLLSKPTLVWDVLAKKTGRQTFNLIYQTAGLSWEAEYIALLNSEETAFDLKARVSVTNNSGTAFKNTALNLVAGSVNRTTAGVFLPAPPMRSALAESMPGEPFSEQQMFEYHLYELDGKTSLMQNETKQLALFEAKNVPVKKTYQFSSNQLNQKLPVWINMSYKNTRSSRLGRPMPAGNVQFYKTSGRDVQFIGEDRLGHTPKNETIIQKIGRAFDVYGKTLQLSHERVSKKVNDYTYQTTLTNRKSKNITILVERELGRNWKILSSTHRYKKTDASRLEFTVPVKKDSQSTLKFTVRYTSK
jgi:hypothetical protein